MKRRIPTAMLAASLILLLAAGCGQDTGTVTRPATGGRTVSETRTYGADPEGTGKLLRDASAFLEAQSTAGSGVHFSLDSTATVAGATIYTQGDGDMVFPDRTGMTTRTLTSGQPVDVEIILVEGEVYTRSALTGGMWRSSGAGRSSSAGYFPPDPRGIRSYLDFARASRNFGQESLRGGQKTYHIQLDVDAALAAEDAKKRTTDPALLEGIEAQKNAVVTVDFWIDTGDLSVAQMIVKVIDPAGGLSSETTLRFSDWGETVQIARPCETC